MKPLVSMALGKRKPKQDELFIPTVKPVAGPGHPFYAKLNEVLAVASGIRRLRRAGAPKMHFIQ